MSNGPIRVAVIGAGINTTKKHIPGFQAIDGVEVVGVVNRSVESSQRVADQFGIPKVYENWGEAVAADDVDAICIGTWPYLHHPIVLEAFESGKHVLTEARMAMDAWQAREMLAESLKHPELVAQIVPADFTLQADQTIIDMISDGFFGRLVSADLAVHSGFKDPEKPHTWRNDRDLSGYNIMLMGAMFESMLRWLGAPVSVAARTRVNVPVRRDAEGNLRHVTVPDHAEIIAEMAAGPLLHMRFSEVAGLGPSEQAWLFGTEGTLKVEIPMNPKGGQPAKLYAGRRGDAALTEMPIPEEKLGGWRVEEEFVNAIRGEEQVKNTTFADGVRYMEFTEAVTRSAQEGRTISLPL